MINKRIAVTLDVDLIRQLSEAAREAGVSRTVFIAALIDNARWGEVSEDLIAERTPKSERGGSDG